MVMSDVTLGSAIVVVNCLERWRPERENDAPAMATGLEDHIWTIRELIEESAKA